MNRKTIAALLLLAAAVCYGLGIVLPIVELKRLYVFTEKPSLVDITWGLYQSGDWLVAAAIGLFSIVFPLIKLAGVFVTAMGGRARRRESRWQSIASVLSKWSMMDVLLVAIFIFAAKTSGLAQAVSQPGIWFYAISAISGAVASALVKR